MQISKKYLQEDKQNRSIYRYMNLEKFVHLIKTNNLHFTRLDRFPDPFEGLITEEQFKGLQDNKYVKKRGDDDSKIFIKNSRKYISLSCWSYAEYESSTMWAGYAPEGVIIESSIERLREAFISPEKNADSMYIANVRYVDYAKPLKWDNNDDNVKIALALHKGLSYQDENEVRVIAKRKVNSETIQFHEKGNKFKIDLDKLIKGIIVAPFKSDWIEPMIKGVLTEYKKNTMIDLVRPSWLEKHFKDVISPKTFRLHLLKKPVSL